MKRQKPEITYRPGKDGVAKILGDLEGLVMETIWSNGSATVREMHDALQAKRRKVAYTTVMTVMTRLHEKEILRRSSEGNAFRYSPAFSREAFLAKASRTVFSGLVDDLSGPVLSTFVDSLNPTEARKLEKLGREIEKQIRARSRSKK